MRHAPPLRTVSLLLVSAAIFFAAAFERPAALAADISVAPEGRVRVELVALRTIEEAEALVIDLGGVIEVVSGGRIQALVTPAAEAALRAAGDVVRIEAPALMMPLQALTPAVVPADELIGAARWRSAGFSGHGTRVGVLDSGFHGVEAALGNTLPADAVLRSFRADGSISGGTEHGRRAAEIIHRTAPGAALYLVNFSTVTELSAAVDYLIEQRVDVISFSLGYIHNGPGDGTGPVNQVVGRAADAGIAWSVAAGNWAQQHWAGPYRDDDLDGVHEFAFGVPENGHQFTAGDLITVSLRWDDVWGAACSDYDLELFGPDAALVRAARGVQNCSGNPVESLQVLATRTGTYYVRVVQVRSDLPRLLDLMVVASPDRGLPLEFATAAGSLSQPADHARVVTVGALTVAATRQEAPYSSRGRTVDGRLKPEILAPTGLAASTAGFGGTSAAAPHVAGVMALFKEAFPEARRERLLTLIQSRAVALPLVPEGSGARRVDLGTLVGLGPLLPVGAEGARILGAAAAADVPLALVIYNGPDGYPARFLHLAAGRPVQAVWAFKLSGVESYARGRPAWANSLTLVDSGQVLMLRFAEQ
ncbi:MAG: S8 family serine peptidase [Chloroflexi bacterium]|nr:S8 family serine peptidase [Chloroflexota bacterium]